MIKGNQKNEKGITLVTLSIAIIIMFIITSILIYNIGTGSKIKALNNMYHDITKLKNKIDMYYINYQTIPILPTKYENTNHIQPINPNDNDVYYVIDLEALENINLSYGKDYKTYQSNPASSLTDLYIINERSHSIYYVKGIVFDSTVYYTIPEENTKVELSNNLNLELMQRNRNVINIKMSAVDKTNGIKKIILLVNEETYKTYEYDGNTREMKTEIEQIPLEERENKIYFQIEDEQGNKKDSNSIVVEKKMVTWVADKAENEIPVPIGFSPITTEDQGTKDTGFVIKNDSDGNEFVWVPVDSTTSYQYERVAFARNGWEATQTLNAETGEIKSSAYYYSETMPSILEGRTELESVTEYGGFYIGRYEAGVTSTTARTSSSGTEDAIVIQKRKKRL